MSNKQQPVYKQRLLSIAIALAGGAVLLLVFAYYTFQRPTVEWVQWGYRGTGLVQLFNKRDINNPAVKALNAVPEAEDKIDPSGQKASEAYQNVQVLKDIELQRAPAPNDGFREMGRSGTGVLLLPRRWAQLL